MVLTTTLILVARSLMVESFSPNEAVVFSSWRMVASMLVKFALLSCALVPVLAAMVFTSFMVRDSSWLVAEICFTDATAWLVDDPYCATTCCCSALVCCMVVAISISVTDEF